MKKDLPKLKSYLNKGQIEAGCDEAGRGCLAGPVVAAAVILPPGFRHKLVRDSKTLTEVEREEAKAIVLEKALDYGIGILDNAAIDKHNILNASFLAMHQALQQLTMVPEHLLIDGNRFIAYKNICHTCVIKGDNKFYNIAAASILAKTHRDLLMCQLHEVHPEYGWNVNKGYPTEHHRSSILQHGITTYHRRSFRLLPEPLQLDLFTEL